MKIFGKKCVAAAVLLAGFWIGDVRGQSVVVNEFRNGTPDIIELLVVEDELDMRGMVIKDFSSNGASDNGGKYTFSTDSLWSALPAGTFIVIRNNNSAADTSVGSGDYNLDVGFLNTTYFTSSGGSVDIATEDIIMIKTAGSDVAGTAGSIHAAASVAASATNFAAIAVPKLKASSGNSQANESVEAQNASAAISDFNGTDALGDQATGTIGTWNTVNNQTYVTNLRGGVGPSTNVQFNGTSVTVGEASGSYTVTVYKTVDSGNLTAEISLSGTATLNGDYSLNTTNITLSGVTTSQTVEITILEDGDVESLETAILNIVNVTGGGQGAPTTFTLSISDNDATPSKLIISEVTDPVSFNARFIELYNAGPTNLDLAAGSWFLSRQSNGGTTWGDIALTGTAIAGSTYVISTTNLAVFASTFPSAPSPDQTSSDINGNGDDGYFLYYGGNHTNGTLADAFGVLNQDGTGQPWEYTDTRAARTSTVTQGSATWIASEWSILPDVDVSLMTPGVHPDGNIVISTNVRFSISAASTNESAGTFVVTINKTTPDGNVSGEITLAGTATEGALNDYTIDTTNFTLNGAVDTTNITITINNDTDQELSETIILGFANVVDAGIAAPATFTLTILPNDAPAPVGGVVWINEINYNPAGADSNEFVEIAGPTGAVLSVYQLIWYNGSGGIVYGSNSLSGVIDDEGCKFGAVAFDTPSNQNGPDGFALVSNGTTVIEFISYGGSFLATEGPAAGLDSTDIGVVQTGTDQNTVQLGGAGDTASEFTWEVAELSRGTLNTNQTITPCDGIESAPILNAIGNKVTLTNELVSFTISAVPTDSDVVTLSVSNAPVGSTFGSTNENGQFNWASPGPAGVYTITFYAADNDGADSETITITVTNSPPPPPAVSRNVWINEIHYDNLGGDTNEGFEVAGDADIDLSAYSIVLYDGTSGFAYSNNVLSGTIPDQSNGIGAVWIDFGYDPAGHIQNGAPDGVALVYNSTGVIQFLSYEGIFTAGDGPAVGLQSTDILVRQNSSTSGTNISYTSDFTLQLCGTGTNYAEMIATGGWQYPQLHTKNAFSSCQIIPGGSLPPPSEYDIGGFSFSGGLPTAAVTTEVGYVYSLQYITNLLSTNVPWLTIDSEAGTGGAVFLNDGSPTNSSRFYRISAE